MESVILSYRNARIEDAQKLKELALTSYGIYSGLLGENWNAMESNIKTMDYVHFLDYAQGFVCETENEIVGMAFLIPSGNPTTIFSAHTSYIRLIGVHPNYSGKGIGRKLTVMCVDYAKEVGEKTVMLHTSEFQNPARHIYESMGFVRVEDLPKIYGKQYYLYKLMLDEG